MSRSPVEDGRTRNLCERARWGGTTIIEAVRGVPAVAQCSCGALWRRPVGDDHADTLPRWTRHHLLPGTGRGGAA